MCQVPTHCGFSGVSPDGNCAYVHWGSFTSNSRSVRRAIWFTWFSEHHECIQHLEVPGGHPSNYQPGATLFNSSDRANHDERTPYSVYKWRLLLGPCCLRLALGVTYLDRMRTIDLHDLTNVPMIKTRMTALAVKTFRSLESTQCFMDLVLNHEIVQKRSGSNTILDQLLAAIQADA